MSIIKFNKDFKDLEDKVLYGTKACCIQKADGDLAKVNGKLVTVTVPTPEDKLELKQVCMEALLTDIQGDTPEYKIKKFILFQKFHSSKKEIDLDATELVMVKDQIAKTKATFIMGQAHDMLEGK